jgi:hypothetical protein
MNIEWWKNKDLEKAIDDRARGLRVKPISPNPWKGLGEHGIIRNVFFQPPHKNQDALICICMVWESGGMSVFQPHSLELIGDDDDDLRQSINNPGDNRLLLPSEHNY